MSVAEQTLQVTVPVCLQTEYQTKGSHTSKIPSLTGIAVQGNCHGLLFTHSSLMHKAHNVGFHAASPAFTADVKDCI